MPDNGVRRSSYTFTGLIYSAGGQRRPHSWEEDVLSVVVELNGQPWTVWMPLCKPLTQSPAVRALPGTEVGEGVVNVSVQYDQVMSVTHADMCDYHSRGRGGCDCGADNAWPDERREVLKHAARVLHAENDRIQDEIEQAKRNAERTKYLEETAWQREPDRIVVGGSEQGWRIWEPDNHEGWRNVGTVVLGSVPLEPYDPHWIALIGDAIGLYSIRDPRIS
ncbi:hypothetical protein ETD86_40955 [Nonomuraea turkmeniaca]|uniref:Uncharacterized protein n=1 Tax=Nonomuraea turkmeniaca TaxID=103838 RepID=A0A5S4F1W8_9ACTN|nr:hypothetical protein [Nonomuraea turkmeniaca]TMR10097.1 hypothetical protein ETD86_40955 [Nonomuraea turkmeniaca]